MWVSHGGRYRLNRASRLIEQIRHRPPPASIAVGALDVLAPVVAQVAARTQGRQIGWVVVRRILVQVGAGQDGGHEPSRRPVRGSAPAQQSTPFVVLFAGFRVQPTALPDHQHRHPVFATTPLATVHGPFELDLIRQFPPVRRIEVAEVGMDGHEAFSLFTAPIKNLVP